MVGFEQNSSRLYLIILVSRIAWREAVEEAGRPVRRQLPAAKASWSPWAMLSASWAESPGPTPLSGFVSQSSLGVQKPVSAGVLLPQEVTPRFLQLIFLYFTGRVLPNQTSGPRTSQVTMESGPGTELSTQTKTKPVTMKTPVAFITVLSSSSFGITQARWG